MKTVKRSNEVLRVTDANAESLVKHEGYSFCPKKEYKVIRDAEKLAAEKRAKEKAAKEEKEVKPKSKIKTVK